MPDSETFKLILNGGSFGLLAIGVVWVLFWGAPMLKNTLEKITDAHLKAIDTVTEHCREETKEQREWLAAEMDKRDAVLERLAGRLADGPGSGRMPRPGGQ